MPAYTLTVDEIEDIGSLSLLERLALAATSLFIGAAVSVFFGLHYGAWPESAWATFWTLVVASVLMGVMFGVSWQKGRKKKTMIMQREAPQGGPIRPSSAGDIGGGGTGGGD